MRWSIPRRRDRRIGAMNTRLSVVLLPLLFAAPLAAQHRAGPAKQNEQLQSLVGNWTGKGTFTEPGGEPTGWHSRVSYRWVLGGHWLQEDFRFEFDGMPGPIAFRSYIGWDAAGERYVVVQATNEGRATIQEASMLPDGTMLTFQQRDMGPAPMQERARTRVAGDKMTIAVDFLFPEGPSMQVVEGTYERGGDAYEGELDLAGHMGAQPHAELQKMSKRNGAYQTEGQMVMAPGQPPTKIRGSDVFADIWSGTVIEGITTGTAEGDPTKYEGRAFYAWDDKAKCIRSVFVDSMGMVGQMEGWFVGDTLVFVHAGKMMGQPLVQRIVMPFEGDAWQQTVSTTCLATADPFVGFEVRYTKKK